MRDVYPGTMRGGGLLTTPPPPPERIDVPLRDGGFLGLAASLGLTALTTAVLGILVAAQVLHAPPGLLVALITFLPWLFVGTIVLAFVVWSAVPDRSAPPIALVLLTAAALLQWGPGWAARGEDAAGTELRVMSWNVRRLWGGPSDGGDAAACVVREVAAVNPDALVLLEVSQKDVEALSKELGLTCTHHPYTSKGGSTRGGLAACARSRWTLRSGQALRFVDGEDWYYVFSEIERDGLVANLLSVHLQPYSFRPTSLLEAASDGLEEASRATRAQSNQSAALLARLERLQDPTLVAGDFNSTRDLALHGSLRHTLVDSFERGGTGLGGTVSAFGWLPLRIDYIYASEAFAVKSASTPAVDCSDHRPVVTDLVLRRTTSGSASVD